MAAIRKANTSHLKSIAPKRRTSITIHRQAAATGSPTGLFLVGGGLRGRHCEVSRNTGTYSPCDVRGQRRDNPDITSDRIAGYIRTRQEAKAAAATIAYELACLKRVFSLAMRAGKAIQRPYIPSVKVDNARKGFFEPADFAAVEAKLPAALRPYVRFLYLTGWRSGEARGLTWADVNFEAGVVRRSRERRRIAKAASSRSSCYSRLPSCSSSSATKHVS